MSLVDVRLDTGATPSSDVVLISRLLEQDAQPISNVFLYTGQGTSSDVVLWNFGTLLGAAQLAVSVSCVATVVADLTAGGAGAVLAADVSCAVTVTATLTAVSAALAASASCAVSATAELTVSNSGTLTTIEICKASEHNVSLMYRPVRAPMIGF